jgi:hypothetical protein
MQSLRFWQNICILERSSIRFCQLRVALVIIAALFDENATLYIETVS